MFSAVSKHSSQANQQKLAVFPFMRPVAKPMPIKQSRAASIEPQYKLSDGDKMKWGKHIWTFFHTIAHKVKAESFPLIRKGLLDMVFTICSSLPCPMCTEHAKQYMRGINYDTIQTKDDLINMFFVFHNSVNARKNYRPFNKDDLHNTYNEKHLMAVIHNFMIAYKDRHRSMKLMADDMLRAQYSVNITNWLNTNLMHFDP